MDKRVIFVNEARTLMVELWTRELVAEVIEAEVSHVNVIRRPTPADTWGPPVKLEQEPDPFVH